MVGNYSETALKMDATTICNTKQNQNVSRNLLKMIRRRIKKINIISMWLYTLFSYTKRDLSIWLVLCFGLGCGVAGAFCVVQLSKKVLFGQHAKGMNKNQTRQPVHKVPYSKAICCKHICYTIFVIYRTQKAIIITCLKRERGRMWTQNNMRCNLLAICAMLFSFCAKSFVQLILCAARQTAKGGVLQSNLDLELELEQIGGNCYNGRI